MHVGARWSRTSQVAWPAGSSVHPFDDDRFIAGNGTIGLEILEDLSDVDAIVAPFGGGGLLAGSIVVSLDAVAQAMRWVAERARVIAEGAAGRGKIVAVVSGGNIDLSRFASLVGACKNLELNRPA